MPRDAVRPVHGDRRLDPRRRHAQRRRRPRLDRHHRHVPDRDLGFNVHEVSGVGILLERQPSGWSAATRPSCAPSPARRRSRSWRRSSRSATSSLVSLGWDKYGGRIDGKIRLADGRDLTTVMIDAGHAAAWDGQGPRPA
jgi:hypothetical protein